jgi:sugar phosphate isomerase/epimerase
MDIAVQLYTLRDACAADFGAALSRVAQIGFRAVELAGLQGRTPKEVRKLLDDRKLKPVSSHTGFEQLRDRFDSVLEEADALGHHFIVCPYLDEKLRQDAAGYRAVARVLQNAGEKLADEGLQLCYHHHDFEFKKFDGRSGIEWLLDATAPETVKLQVDTYWVHAGGEDPAEFIRKLHKRCPIIHLKDRAPDGSFAEVGSGTFDFDAILAAAKGVGAAAVIVEQDSCPRDPFDCIAVSLKYLKSKGIQ